MAEMTQGIWGLSGFWRDCTRLQRLALAAILAAGAVLRIVGILQTDQTAVVNMPLPDDAFYYFTLARSASSGAGLAVAGDGTATVGFQPLWAMILIAVQSILGRLPAFDPIAWAQSLGALFGLASGLAVVGLAYRLSREPWAGLLAGFCYLLSPQVLKHNLNGMETSLAILAALALMHIALTASTESWSPGKFVLLGLIGALAVLARTDLVILFGVVALLTAVRALPGSGDALPARQVGAHILGLAGGLILPLLPWVIMSNAIGGSPIPESGAAVRNLTLFVRHQPFGSPIAALVENSGQILPFYADNAVQFTSAWMRQTPLLLPALLPLFAALGLETGLPVSALLSLPLLVAGLGVIRPADRGVKLAAGALILYAGLMTIAYAAFILGPWFYQRYAAPIAVLANPLLIVAAARLVEGKPWSRWAAAAMAITIGAAFAALVVSGSYRWIVRGPQAVPDDGFYRTALYLDEELPPGSRVGVFSAGLISYYSDQVIIPLDGKVHRGAREALAHGRMLEFLCRERIGYLADWPEMIRNLVERRSGSWHSGALRELERIDVESYDDLVVMELTDGACAP